MLRGGKAGVISFGDKRSNRTGSEEEQVLLHEKKFIFSAAN